MRFPGQNCPLSVSTKVATVPCGLRLALVVAMPVALPSRAPGGLPTSTTSLRLRETQDYQPASLPLLQENTSTLLAQSSVAWVLFVRRAALPELWTVRRPEPSVLGFQSPVLVTWCRPPTPLERGLRLLKPVSYPCCPPRPFSVDISPLLRASPHPSPFPRSLSRLHVACGPLTRSAVFMATPLTGSLERTCLQDSYLCDGIQETIL